MAWEKENAMLYIENRRMLLRKRRMPIIYRPGCMDVLGKGERLLYVVLAGWLGKRRTPFIYN